MKKLLHTGVILSLLAMLIVAVPADASLDDQMVRVGLYYGSSALATANLENSVGSGYRFGYFDGSDRYVELGSTGETQISMLKTQNIYLKDDLYSDSNPGNSAGVIGSYHIQLSGTYRSFQDAQSEADLYSGGFPAWIAGDYVVRVGAYTTRDEAASAQADLGIGNGSIVGTSSSGITVTKTKTTTVLFQFDSEGSQIFAVKPGQNDSIQTVTWFKGYRYYGAFLYERIDGGNLTVVNFLDMDSYVKGILPYEMSASWPIEALKAQAVSARSYTLSATGNKHSSHHFDVCNTTDCQVYYGVNNATDNTNRAVEETSGIYAWYNGSIIQAFYYSSNGGASEDVRNVWSATANLPYLAGVIDPYEATIESSISSYRWSTSFTSAELTTLLQSKGYSCSSIVDFYVSEYTDLGNVFSITFVDSNGNTFPFTRERARITLNLRSQRYTVTGGSGGASANVTTQQTEDDVVYYVDDAGDTLTSLNGTWVVDEKGKTVQLEESTDIYAITSSGTEQLITGSGGGNTTTGGSMGSNPAGTFTIAGSGYGHHVGMSQWGAYAMAQQGYSYRDILTFYFTGIDLY